MEECTVRAYAKINLGLDVLKRRDDGYHELRMIMQDLELCDLVTIRRLNDSEAGNRGTDGLAGETHSFVSGSRQETGICAAFGRKESPKNRISGRVTAREAAPGLEMDEKNLAWRAALLLMEEFRLPGQVEILLEKRIPMAAGLAGGSADAAAVLRGMNTLFRLNLTEAELMKRGVTLGADIPYCVTGGTALAEGIGEKLTALPSPPGCQVILVKPPEGVSTGYVYGNLQLDRIPVHPDIDCQIQALETGDLSALAAKMDNLLETVTVPAIPRIRIIREALMEQGALGARMSGSGPTVFGLFEHREQAVRAREALEKAFPDCRVIHTAFRNRGECHD